MQLCQFGKQLRFGFGVVRVRIDAFDRAHHHALGLIKMAHALGAAGRVDDVNVFALGNGLVRAGRFADITVDAQGVDLEGHGDIVERGGLSRAVTLPRLRWRLLAGIDKHVIKPCRRNRFTHALAIGGFADEQQAHTFHAVRGHAFKRLHHDIGDFVRGRG